MAIAVNTWAEFIAAYENGSDGTIEIMSDLDANDDLPDKTYSRPISKTINGNGHTIYNISTQAVVNNPIFRSVGNSLVINNTNFYNCYRIENQPIFWGSPTYRAQFNDCKIVGRGLQYIASQGTFQRCSFSWSGVKAADAGTNNSFYNSWVKIDNERTSNSNSALFGTLNNSYIEGSVKQTAAGTFSLKISSNLESSVINIETSATSATFPSGNTSVYNSTKAPNFTDSGNCIGVTDAQMKDALYLAGIGFNIVT